MKIRNTVGITTILLALISPLLVSLPASALGQSITLSPTSAELTISPGARSNGLVEVLNQGGSPYAFKAYVTSYHVNSEAYNPSFTPLPGAPQVSNWIALGKTSGMLNAGQTADVPYTITVPADTPAGGYYATLFAETQTTTPTKGVVLNERVGTIFYITVTGSIKTSGKTLSWHSSFFQTPPLIAHLRIANAGNVHFPVSLQSQVTDIFGHQKYSQNTVKEVLPQTIRSIPVTWQTAPSIGLVKISGTVQYLGKTQVLSSHYILILSSTVRTGVLAVACTLVILAMLLHAAQRKITNHER